MKKDNHIRFKHSDMIVVIMPSLCAWIVLIIPSEYCIKTIYIL
jgi:hypothetical protein